MVQLTSHQNEGLFQRAIIQSGMFAPVYGRRRSPLLGTGLAEAEQKGIEFFKFLGVSSLAEARDLDAQYLMDKALEYKGFWGTVIDGVFCPGSPFDMFWKTSAFRCR